MKPTNRGARDPLVRSTLLAQRIPKFPSIITLVLNLNSKVSLHTQLQQQRPHSREFRKLSLGISSCIFRDHCNTLRNFHFFIITIEEGFGSHRKLGFFFKLRNFRHNLSIGRNRHRSSRILTLQNISRGHFFDLAHGSNKQFNILFYRQHTNSIKGCGICQEVGWGWCKKTTVRRRVLVYVSEYLLTSRRLQYNRQVRCGQGLEYR